MMKCASHFAASALLVLCGAAGAQPMQQGMPNDSKVPGLEVFVEHSERMIPFARTDTGRAFVDAVKSLPNQLRRYFWTDRRFTVAYSEAEYASLPEDRRRQMAFRPVTEMGYYLALSERPLMDVQTLDLAIKGTPMASPEGLVGKRILIFNPRVITQGRLLASLGADVTIVHDQQRMSGFYSEAGDVGTIEGHGDAPAGTLRLIRSEWPGVEDERVGTGYDLIFTSNWVSQGLCFPTMVSPRWVTPGKALHPLPCEAGVFIEGIAEALAPGGRFINYTYGTIEPRMRAYADPNSDVRLPISTEEIADAGLEILALDADDSKSVLNTSIATGFDEPMVRPEDGVPTMLAVYTLLEKPAAAE